MLIPSIDLMGGKIVQLVQGEKKALEFDDFAPWVERFAKFPIVQLIDLDAAMGKGSNRALISHFCGALPCQVGGGIRTLDAARQLLSEGARKVIFGSALIRDGYIDSQFAGHLCVGLGPECLIFAIDTRGGKLAIRGWQQLADVTPLDMIRALDQQCSGFLYTHVETEGLMNGFPIDAVRPLRAATSRQLIAAGGITTQAEIDELDRMKVDAVVGMAIYTGRLVT